MELTIGLGDPASPSVGPRSSLVGTTPSSSPSPSLLPTPPSEPLRLQTSKSPPLPARSPLRPPARSLIAPKDAYILDMPTSMLRMGSLTSFSLDTLVDNLPSSNFIIDGAFLLNVNEKPKVPPLISMPRTPSPDKPLPITPSSTSSPTLTEDSIPDSLSVRDPIDSPPPSAILPPKRTHALLELIESERAYASDLALIRDIHLPVAHGHEPPIPTPPQSSSSSVRTLSTASGSSTTSLGPPMTREDARIIFSNISELAHFADEFVTCLEIALGSAVPNGEGEDTVGSLFIEMIPRMETPYMLYITHHPAALARLNSLPQTPALAAYHATTRTLAQQLSHAWDLPSLLIKPVQRLLKYALLLHAIIEETPDSHGDKEDLRRAKSMVEAVSHAINESQRRREIVKEVLAAGKPSEVLKKKGLGIVGRVRGGVSAPRGISRADSEEAERVAQMERDMHRTDEFIQQFAKDTVEWVKSVQSLVSALRIWAEGFGRVIGLGPDVNSEAFDAFLVVIDKQLTSLGVDLEVLVREQLLPQLRALVETAKRPTLLLDTLHALEPHHYALLQHNAAAKGRPPSALHEASIAYGALRAQLREELPAYLSLLHSGVTLCVGRLAKWQARLWRDVRTRWSELWDALRVEGEMNAGSEETERVWRARWEEAARDLRGLNIIQPENITIRLKQARSAAAAAAATPPSPTIMRKRGSNASSSARRLARPPSTESLRSVHSAKSSSGHGHYGEVLEPSSPPQHLPMPRRQSMSTPLRREKERGREKEKDREEERGRGAVNPKQNIVDSLLPSLPRHTSGSRRARPRTSDAHHPHVHHHPRRHPHPPVPPAPQLMVSSRWHRAPALYACRVIHECDPPEGVQYYGLPFFKLYLGDVYQVLKEAGHPSRHRDLPLLVDDGEDCLLLARDTSGALGWLLASFLFPVD
ncbi:hypothetical protein B0F90DRAFT_1714807 [Multifurca ochricompacta]|uniref:DH domain-containing protein n=1 Tax=Multifurca ochricompacta TaxID=376703 RepID=A0AAD4QP97_9AGAM|nr:hypothetical protein B0F90DRAFT_1714807 [Multifurca ochricompacta]